MSDVTAFNIFYWESYDINGVDFNQYIRQNAKDIDANAVLNFIENSNQQLLCEVDDISVFLLYYPNSYFLVGGRGHWSYAVNKNLFSDESDSSSDSGSPVSVGGNDSKLAIYNLRVTKKIKNNNNKYYQKSSSSKATKKHKRTIKINNGKEYKNGNKKGNKKTIKYTR
jgi:hypothetical protein